MDDMYLEVYEKLTRLQWSLHKQQMFAHAEYGPFADTSRGQGRVLAILKIKPEISTKDLAYLLGIRQQSLNELLNKLEKKEYIERIPCEDDKRILLIHLTEKGENAQQTDVDYSEMFACLSEEELRTFENYLDRIIESIESKIGDDDHDEMKMWMENARERIGPEDFDRLMRMRHGGSGPFGFRGSFYEDRRHDFYEREYHDLD
ncbi:MarR family winged helix-turn-helix transcriptional regulator [Candidatus Methanomassiliicoccus intestinalis]|jgi:transcriptional regulator, MarR family|uniref:HTH marR-type domain-containing protein n=1 Tax=Candidatus Methanomassiliicoccus intestinalis TaxID=1406512 RepID=A0A8J8PH31_9ARCH|nr:MAG: hypothetical protein A3206_07110 [Candidatus Methanomassiliicoccus intestinalis]TQS84118.1 MAG: hypothetical protein A3207_07335 [Candidatus Methanomassiliicoccus intestinalis]